MLRALALGFDAGDTTSETKADAWSVYGQASYKLTDRLNLTGSLRWIYEKKVASYPAQTTPVYDPVAGAATPVAVAAASASEKVRKEDGRHQSHRSSGQHAEQTVQFRAGKGRCL